MSPDQLLSHGKEKKKKNPGRLQVLDGLIVLNETGNSSRGEAKWTRYK